MLKKLAPKAKKKKKEKFSIVSECPLNRRLFITFIANYNYRDYSPYSWDHKMVLVLPQKLMISEFETKTKKLSH